MIHTVKQVISIVTAVTALVIAIKELKAALRSKKDTGDGTRTAA
ncbi:MAG TPA: hypothetical protein V6D17_00595 [Candidatus Obscuribacterales bacterium]